MELSSDNKQNEIHIQKPTGLAAEQLFAYLAKCAKVWYEDPENLRRFEEWQKNREAKQ